MTQSNDVDNVTVVQENDADGVLKLVVPVLAGATHAKVTPPAV